MDNTLISQIIAAFLMICVYTFLYKENPVYRIAEHAMVGASAGYYFVTNLNYIIKSGWSPMLAGKPHYIIALVLGLLLFANLIPKYSWLSRYGLAVVTGAGIALAVSRVILTNVIKQAETAVAPILTASSATDWVNLIISLVLTLTVIYYFTYTSVVRPTKLDKLQFIGRLGLMVAFGVGYGQTTSYRLNLIIGRIDALLEPTVRMYSIALAILLMAVVLYWDYKLRRN